MREVLGPILVMVMASAALCATGWYIGKRSRRWGTALAIIAVALLLLQAMVWGGSLLVAQVLPIANAIVYGDVQSLAAGLLAGAAWSLLRTPRWQRAVLVILLTLIATYRAFVPYAGSPPAMSAERWSNGVCRQSTTATCSPAAAATALRAIGIQSSEAEMAKLCLTRPEGTYTLGIFRGLKLKTSGTAYDAVPFTGSMSDLLASGQAGPVVLSIGGLQRTSDGQSASLIPGAAHSIVLFGKLDSGKLDIGDPFAGRQQWNVHDLEQVWTGEAIRLVQREARTVPK